jgi:CBS domain-containing membrane protein
MKSSAPSTRRKLYLHEPVAVRRLMGGNRVVGLLRRFPERWVWAAFVFLSALLSMAILGVIATLARTPFVFPSVGPTAMLFFFHPMSPSASPRHAIYGHAIGILCGYGSVWLVGLQHAPSAIGLPMGFRRILAVALSLAFSGSLMILLRAAHAPAAATTLILSLGLVTRPLHLVAIELAVILLSAEAVLVNRAAGLPYPFWSWRADSSMERLDVAPPPPASGSGA